MKEAPDHMPRRGSKTQNRQIIPIARDAWRFLLPLIAAVLIFWILSWQVLAVLALLLAIFVAFFFRDPERLAPDRPDLILSPADGKVTSISEVEMEPEPGLRQRMVRVQIFLSVFNAHIQRSPTDGVVESVKYNPGKFLNALNDKASEDNENNMIWLRGPMGMVGVKQIAGIIARRVVCTCRPGQRLAAGERIGLIRFGSRAEVYFSPRARVQAFAGQRVKAGLTIMAVMPALNGETE